MKQAVQELQLVHINQTNLFQQSSSLCYSLWLCDSL